LSGIVFRPAILFVIDLNVEDVDILLVADDTDVVMFDVRFVKNALPPDVGVLVVVVLLVELCVVVDAVELGSELLLLLKSEVCFATVLTALRAEFTNDPVKPPTIDPHLLLFVSLLQFVDCGAGLDEPVEERAVAILSEGAPSFGGGGKSTIVGLGLPPKRSDDD